MNKANSSNKLFTSIKGENPCVFISHKKEDQNIAIAIADYIENVIGYDVYVDLFDVELQEAVSEENDANIVKSIKRGLSLSNILLCIVTEKTKMSWWVPYEIGIADEKNLSIATIRTKDIDDIPSFLKTKRNLNNIYDLICFLLCNGRYGSLLFSDESAKKMRQGDVGKLEEYFD